VNQDLRNESYSDDSEFDSEAWVLRKMKEYLLDVFQRNYLRNVLGTRLTDRISNISLYEKFGSILFSRAIMRES